MADLTSGSRSKWQDLLAAVGNDGPTFEELEELITSEMQKNEAFLAVSKWLSQQVQEPILDIGDIDSKLCSLKELKTKNQELMEELENICGKQAARQLFYFLGRGSKIYRTYLAKKIQDNYEVCLTHFYFPFVKGRAERVEYNSASMIYRFFVRMFTNIYQVSSKILTPCFKILRTWVICYRILTEKISLLRK